jgi:hypothetical protein
VTRKADLVLGILEVPTLKADSLDAVPDCELASTEVCDWLEPGSTFTLSGPGFVVTTTVMWVRQYEAQPILRAGLRVLAVSSDESLLAVDSETSNCATGHTNL